GMLVVRTRSEAERLSWTRLMSFSDRPGTTWIDGEGHPAASNALRFNATIDYSAAAAIFQGARRSLDQVLTDAAHRGSRPGGFALPGSARARPGGPRGGPPRQPARRLRPPRRGEAGARRRQRDPLLQPEYPGRP